MDLGYLRLRHITKETTSELRLCGRKVAEKMRLRQAKKIRMHLMRRSLSKFGWEDIPIPRWTTTVQAARRLKKLSKVLWWDTLHTWCYETDFEKQ